MNDSQSGIKSSGWFDRFAGTVGRNVARAWFFTACFLLVVLWAPTIFILSFTAWNFAINTATTIITFLLVALLQNTQDRSTRAINHKLDALALGLADVLDNTDGTDEAGKRAQELRRTSGIELESSS